MDALWIEIQRLPVLSDSLIISFGSSKQVGKAAVCHRHLRGKPNGLLERLESGFAALFAAQGVAKIKVRFSQRGIKPYRLLLFHDGPVNIILQQEGNAEVGVPDGIARIKL